MDLKKNTGLLSSELSSNNLSLDEKVDNDININNKKTCPICYDLIQDKFDLDCCDADICQICIDALIEPKCPYCRTIIKKIANDPKYRLSSSCPTRDYLSEHLISQYQQTNRYLTSDDIDLTNRVRLNNRRRIMSTISEINAERRDRRIANGSITPYSRSRTNSEITNQIREGIEVYIDSLQDRSNNSGISSETETEIDSDDVFRLES